MFIISGDNNRALVADEVNVITEQNDNAVIQRLRNVVDGYDPAVHGGKRLDVVLLLQSMTSLWLMLTVGLSNDIKEKADVIVTTKEDILAKSLFVKLPGIANHYPSLDRRPIGRDSEVTVHLVIFGFNAMAEALALNASLVAHYPNYCRDTRLRTRITIVDSELYAERDRFIQRYSCLFDNSWYRTIDLEDSNPACVTHQPMYAGRRKDFVDVEWEFVRGSVSNGALRQKLAEWSRSSLQQLTIAVCHDNKANNMDEALAMPKDVFEARIPVFCYTDESDLLQLAVNDPSYRSIVVFNSRNCDIGLLRTLQWTGKMVNYIYDYYAHLGKDDVVSAPSAIDEEKLDVLWGDIPSFSKQYSNIYYAMTLGTKMHSIGHDEQDWDAYYAMSKAEIELLAEVEHNRWNVEELILGYRPCTDEEMGVIDNDKEQKKVLRQRKIHYDLRAYDDLRTDSTGKVVNVYDEVLTQAIPLIIKTCITD